MNALPDERPPRLAVGMVKRFLLGMVIITLLSAASVATAVLLEVKNDANIFQRAQIPIPNIKGALDDVQGGGPQTILVLGSDRRFADIKQKNPVRSDTIMLVRLDPSKGATAVMNVPRDLKVQIPGHGEDKINAAYAYGGPSLSVKTLRSLLHIPINHVVNVNFGGFKHAVNRLKCVYVDVDRKYFNDNSPPFGGGPDYATINVPAGYQRLCGQDALDYVRYRHFDTDLVRAARQQDFLRQAKDQVGVSRLFGDRTALLKIFGKYTQTDIRGTTAILRLLKLVAESASHPVQEVHFPGTAGPTYVTTSQNRLQKAVHDFLNAEASASPRGASTPAKHTPHRKRTRAGVPRGLVLNKTLGEDQAIALATHLHFPVYYPKLLAARGNYRVPDRRAYDIYDRGRHRYRAYRIVAFAGDIGQYYGVQGTTWSSPPILDNPSETRKINGRKFELFFDGSRLRLVAYRSKRAVYWVSNTLLETLTNQQMLALASSLTRVGR
ncbi:MAG: polyisoprenyl-teichoic acid--peptidoglycan teichoic acid transferase [Solirubrobacteraceae bacterium]|jgi:LCP family protein required for cell wall assembly|nr:polyisoprenyl-teichoic acid--peptidoglycan teichoic acid transferase [Solirubrobacteraceae bacterium]